MAIVNTQPQFMASKLSQSKLYPSSSSCTVSIFIPHLWSSVSPNTSAVSQFSREGKGKAQWWELERGNNSVSQQMESQGFCLQWALSGKAGVLISYPSQRASLEIEGPSVQSVNSWVRNPLILIQVLLILSSLATICTTVPSWYSIFGMFILKILCFIIWLLVFAG